MPRIETACDPGGSVCEDLARTTEGAAWVFDGTSGFGERSFTDAVSDGRWYVETLDSALGSRISRDESLETLLETAIADTAQQLAQCVPDDADASLDTAVKRYELPACSVSVLRWDDERVDYLNLCDASLLYGLSDGSVERVTTPGVLAEVDAETQRLRNLAGDDTAEATDEDVRSYIRDTRQYANTPGGYWVAQQNPLAARFATTGTVDRSQLEAAILCSDGIEPIVELHDDLADWSSVLSFSVDEGVEAVVDAVRDAEAALTESAQPAVRTGDDIGLALAVFGT